MSLLNSKRLNQRVHGLTVTVKLFSTLRCFRTCSHPTLMIAGDEDGGQSKYEKGGRLNINLSLFDKLREYFAQFGLGVRTGIDLPNEGKSDWPTVVQPMPRCT